MLLVSAVAASPGGAQRADSARVGTPVPVVQVPADSLLRPPISPRRAFLSSLVFPGAGQAALRRPVSGTVYATSEILALLMIAKSREDLRLAKAAPRDVFIGYRVHESGTIIIDPASPEALVIVEPHPLPPRIRARRQHLEDWVAFLIFNHFFSASDAFVAAHLWEVPARVSLQPRPAGLALSMSVTW